MIVLPSVLKAAFIAGGSYGRARGDGVPHRQGFYRAMGSSRDVRARMRKFRSSDWRRSDRLMSGRGVKSLLHSKVKLGGDASIAAGPLSRTAAAETDAYMRSEMLSYSRARGVFAGILLEGSTLRPDDDANRRVYGNEATAVRIIKESKYAAPDAGKQMVTRLQKASPQLKP